jgi:DNA modification methylase
MGADEFGDSGGKAEGAHRYKDDKETFLTIVGTFAAESFRIAKQQAHAYIFCDLDNFHELKRWMLDAGWEVHRTPLIWYKPSGNRTPWVNYGPQRQYELILYAVKGKKNCNSIAPDVLTHRSDTNLGHSAQKPVSLLVELLKRSVRAGDSIFDPFMGTGSTIAAGHELKCTVTGIELDSNSYGIAVQRVQSLK